MYAAAAARLLRNVISDAAFELPAAFGDGAAEKPRYVWKSGGSGPASSTPGSGRISLINVRTRSDSPFATDAGAAPAAVRCDLASICLAIPSRSIILSMAGRLAPVPGE